MLNLFKNTFAAMVLAGLVWVGAALADVNLPGFDRLVVSAAHRPGLVAGSIWYPAGQATYKTQVTQCGFHRHTRLSRPRSCQRALSVDRAVARLGGAT